MIPSLSAVASMFRPKPAPHKEPRYYAATKEENAAARQKRADILCELAVYAAVTTPEQRKAEADAYHEQFMRKWPKLRATQRLMRAVGREG